MCKVTGKCELKGDTMHDSVLAAWQLQALGWLSLNPAPEVVLDLVAGCQLPAASCQLPTSNLSTYVLALTTIAFCASSENA